MYRKHHPTFFVVVSLCFVMLALEPFSGCSDTPSTCQDSPCNEKAQEEKKNSTTFDTNPKSPTEKPKDSKEEPQGSSQEVTTLDGSLSQESNSPDASAPEEEKGTPDNPEPSREAGRDKGTPGVPESPKESGSQEKAPCQGKACGTNAFCDQKTDKCQCKSGYTGNPNTSCQSLKPKTAWIGSPCSDSGTCNFTGGYCLVSNEGYPDGMCSKDCSRLCPDSSGHPVTFCIAPPGSVKGRCFSRCDTSRYPTNSGCRKNYSCIPWKRHNQSSIVQNVCVPSSWKNTNTSKCNNPTNLLGDDNCYLDLVSFNNKTQRTLVLKLLQGTASSQEARSFLDLNYASSQDFMKNELHIKKINKNYSTGHRSSTPMNGMILHYTANQVEDGTIRYFVGGSAHASTHFIIGSKRNGLLVQIFSHKHRTWHAGSKYNNDRFGMDFANAGYLKSSSGGSWVDYAKRKYTLVLPLHGNKPVTVRGGIPTASSKYARLIHWQPYTYYQLLTYLLVSRALHKVYTLKPSRIQRHGDVSSSRVDPGPALPTTALTKLIFSSDNVFKVKWLNDYKVQKDWIAQNPQAR